jgi:hypothetical protein
MHNGAMRTHAEIIRAVGEGEIADLTGAPILTVRSWAQRDSIPSKHWGLLVSKKHCTADELMAAAAKRAA